MYQVIEGRIDIMKYSREEIAEAREELLKLCPVGKEIYTVVAHSTRSGGVHTRLLVMAKDAEGEAYLRDITRLAARIMGERVTDYGGIYAGGYGYSKTFHTLYSFSRALRPDGHKCTGSNGYSVQPSEENGWKGKRSRALRCPSNDHSNGMREYSKRTTHSDSGYALPERHL